MTTSKIIENHRKTPLKTIMKSDILVMQPNMTRRSPPMIKIINEQLVKQH